ncbi:MAG: hypothetical protein RIF32_14925 [Leptospirales bacterium]|jgi:hypothetical protein
MKERSTGEILMEIVSKVRDLNLNEKKDYPIPVSDTMFRKYFAPIMSSEEQMKEYLHILVESHYLFPLSIVEPDDTLMISGAEGYVVTDIAALKTLRGKTEEDLEIAYEQQMYRRKQAATIMRELLPQARNYNNTPLGRSLNVAVMLSQFEQVLISGFAEYTDSWKRNKLKELLPDIDVSQMGPAEGDAAAGDHSDPLAFDGEASEAPADDFEEQPFARVSSPTPDVEEYGGPPDMDHAADLSAPPPDPPPAPTRAVDSLELNQIQEMDRSGQWGKAVDRYGVQFLLRIHFRKYEFDKVRWLLRTGKVAREEDVRFIRDTIRTMEGRVSVDLKLGRFLKDMADIRRIAQMKLNSIHQVKKNL